MPTAAGDITARFDETMRAGLTEEGLAEAWAYLAGLAGAYESHGDTDAVRAGDYTITNTPLAFEAGDFVARITFRDDRTIAGLYILNPEAANGEANQSQSRSESAQTLSAIYSTSISVRQDLIDLVCLEPRHRRKASRGGSVRGAVRGRR